MELKVKDKLKFTTPVGDKIGELEVINGEEYLIRDSTFPHSIWTRKASDIIEKINKNEKNN